MSALNARKATFETALKNREYAEKKAAKVVDPVEKQKAIEAVVEIPKDQWWTAADGRELEEQVELAKRGLLFLAITK